MCALTVRMLVRQPMMLFSFVFVKWIPDRTLILPKRGKKGSHPAQTHEHSNRLLSDTQNRQGKAKYFHVTIKSYLRFSPTDMQTRIISSRFADLKSDSGGHSSLLHSMNS